MFLFYAVMPFFKVVNSLERFEDIVRNPSPRGTHRVACLLTVVGSNVDGLIDRLAVALPLLYENYVAQYGHDVVILHRNERSDFERRVAKLEPRLALKYFDISSKWRRPAWMQKEVVKDLATVARRKLHDDDEEPLHRWSARVCVDFNLDYRFAQRFFAHTLFETELCDRYDWFVRLDTDLFFLRKFHYDPVDVLARQQRFFGFLRDGLDDKTCNAHLWNAAQTYVTNRAIRNDWIDDLPEFWSFTAYFEIFRTSFFKSKQYLDFTSFIDDQGGFFAQRWTDGDVHLLGMAATGAPKSKILCFGDFDDFVMHVKNPQIALDELKDARFAQVVFNYKSAYFDNANESMIERRAIPRHLAFQQLHEHL